MFRKEKPVRKPAPKNEFTIVYTFPLSNNIEFEASRDIIQEIRNSNFGEITLQENKRHNLNVSSLFSFEEVLAYLRSFK